MANSNYYYNLYKQNDNSIRSYNNNLRELRKILNALTSTMSDEISAVNRELDDLKSDLNKSVRHNSTFLSRANSATAEKEKSVTADPDLSIAVRELEGEISRINGLVNSSVSNRDLYYQKYKDERQQEIQDFFRR